MNDFAHRLKLDRIHDGDRLDLTADEVELRSTGERLGLTALERLEAHVALARDGESIRARGRLQAAVQQNCVVTGEPIAALVDERFDILFLPEPKAGAGEDEIELAEGECDVVFHDGAAIDLGAAIADTLALNLDPYPRSASAETALREAGVLTEAQASPFAALAKLRLSGSEQP